MKLSDFRKRVVPGAALALTIVLRLAAQTVPATMNYQGRLTDNSPGQTPVTAAIPMRFDFFDAASAGGSLWSETAAVAVTGGVFSVQLGSVNPLPPSVFASGAPRWLQITLNPGTGNEEILLPRQALGMSGYAAQSQQAAQATDSAQLGGVAGTGWQKALTGACSGGQYLTGVAQNGSPACGTPATVLTPPISLSSAQSQAILGATNSGTGHGLFGYGGSGSTSAGVAGTTGSGYAGVYGYTFNSGANAMGIYGESSYSTSGIGIMGRADAAGATGVRGYSTGGTGVSAASGSGVALYATSNTGTSLSLGSGNSGNAADVLYMNHNGSGTLINAISNGGGRLANLQQNANGATTDAVYVTQRGTGAGLHVWNYGTGNGARFDQANGAAVAAAVAGATTAANGVGLSGSALTGGSAMGVYGEASNGYGVYGKAGSGGYAITGVNTAGGIAGYFSGNVSVSGGVAASGRIAIGLYTQVCAPNAATYDCFCNGVDPAIGGGGYGHYGESLRESRPGNASTAWRVSCMNTAGTDVTCWGAYAVCLSHGS